MSTAVPVLTPLKLNPPLNAKLVKDSAGLALVADFLQRTKVYGWDIETTPLRDFFFRRCRTIQIGNQTEQYVIDLLAFCGGDSDLLYKAQGYYGINMPDSLREVFDVISPSLVSDEWLKVGVSLSFEYMNFYWLFGIRSHNFFDCALVEKVIWAGAHSMKDYGYFSMEEMMGRYFQVSIDKSLQESFLLEGELTQEQVDYAALDTRTPMGLRSIQNLVLNGHTYASLSAAKSPMARNLQFIDPVVTGDNLVEIARIENEAIGAFQDMHVHGERIDRETWRKRIDGKVEELQGVLKRLDDIFIPIVGTKTEVITDEMIAESEAAWKKLTFVNDEELKLKSAIRAAKLDPILKLELETKKAALEATRKAEKDILKAEHSTLKKKRTAIKNLAEKCEGNALINYGSGAQLLNILTGMKGLGRLTDTEDETLEKFEHLPVMKALRDYRGLTKEIGTYGYSWVTEWVTKPCKEEGWLHPGDGRLHCVFNQYDAETGRSTSEKPNGQNLPQDKAVRSCFIADPPDESIRISNCCDADTTEKFNNGYGGYLCVACRTLCETHAEEYVIVTADMSGAELRIIAEEADDPIWIEAFARGEDVHSVGTELLYGTIWSNLAYNGQELKNEKTGEMEPYWCEYYKLHDAASVAKNPKGTIGQPMRQKCRCPEHKVMRDGNKATNFLLAYGGGPNKLAVSIKKSVDEARDLMGTHEHTFPRIWKYLANSGFMAKVKRKAFDMFGRRRLFPEPTDERCLDKARDDFADKLKHTDEICDQNIASFIAQNNRKPSQDEKWFLTHRDPDVKQRMKARAALVGSMERQGKNHSIQSANATIAKLAMGAGKDKNGVPFLWHLLPQYKAKLVKFVHDELVVQCPKRFGEKVAALIGDAFKRAAAERMSKVEMTFDFNVAGYWKK